MWIASDWKEYEVLDASGGEKLERWGDYILLRPDPQVLWNTEKTAAEWKKLNETQDINMLLANRINHPTKEMHELFADKLFKTIFGEENNETTENDDTMYR